MLISINNTEAGPAEKLCDLAMHGELTEAAFRDFQRKHDSGIASPARREFIHDVGWWIPTVEYLDVLTKYVRGKRVLEVCAGDPNVGVIMRERGIDWVPTDASSKTGVIKMDALEAIRTIPHDIVFAAWIPYRSTLDYEIAKLTAQEGRPFILIGEGYGGCTGSEKFWERAGKDGYVIREGVFDPDIPSWDGIHDRTFLVERA